jgi:hypothetical protein
MPRNGSLELLEGRILLVPWHHIVFFFPQVSLFPFNAPTCTKSRCFSFCAKVIARKSSSSKIISHLETGAQDAESFKR